MTHLEKRKMVEQVEMYDAVMKQAWKKAHTLAADRVKSNDEIGREALPQIKISIFDEFKESFGDRPERPPVPSELKI